jgi:hypothetical protein
MIILHCKQGTSDKIWGWTKVTEGGAVCFWGRRKGTLNFIYHADEYNASKVARTKFDKGYHSINMDQKAEYLPDDFQGQLMLAMLGQVREAVH